MCACAPFGNCPITVNGNNDTYTVELGLRLLLEVVQSFPAFYTRLVEQWGGLKAFSSDIVAHHKSPAIHCMLVCVLCGVPLRYLPLDLDGYFSDKGDGLVTLFKTATAEAETDRHRLTWSEDLMVEVTECFASLVQATLRMKERNGEGNKATATELVEFDISVMSQLADANQNLAFRLVAERCLRPIVDVLFSSAEAEEASTMATKADRAAIRNPFVPKVLDDYVGTQACTPERVVVVEDRLSHHRHSSVFKRQKEAIQLQAQLLNSEITLGGSKKEKDDRSSESNRQEDSEQMGKGENTLQDSRGSLESRNAGLKSKLDLELAILHHFSAYTSAFHSGLSLQIITFLCKLMERTTMKVAYGDAVRRTSSSEKSAALDSRQDTKIGGESDIKRSASTPDLQDRRHMGSSDSWRERDNGRRTRSRERSLTVSVSDDSTTFDMTEGILLRILNSFPAHAPVDFILGYHVAFVSALRNRMVGL